MPRTLTYTDQPSTGKSLQLVQKALGTDWTILCEVPLFSIPRTSSELASEFIDSSRPGEERELVLGEIFINAPLLVSNLSNSSVTVEVRISRENGDVILLTPVITIPPNDGVRLNIQGQTLVGYSPSALSGDQLQVRAGTGGVLDVFGAATESSAASHAPDSETL